MCTHPNIQIYHMSEVITLVHIIYTVLIGGLGGDVNPYIPAQTPEKEKKSNHMMCNHQADKGGGEIK